MPVATPVAPRPVDYLGASRRHFSDAKFLLNESRKANAGQLLGFSVECGLKALLAATGAQTDAAGNVLKRTGFRSHMPDLGTLISQTSILPDGRQFASFQAQMPNLGAFYDWHTDHRYWREAALPSASLPNWERAALEVNSMLDQAKADGLL